MSIIQLLKQGTETNTRSVTNNMMIPPDLLPVIQLMDILPMTKWQTRIDVAPAMTMPGIFILPRISQMECS